MTIHVNIGEAKTRLSELLRRVAKGERVIIQRDGKPEAELVSAQQGSRLTHEERAARRRAAFGMYKDAYKGFDTSLQAIRADRVNEDERMRRKFGATD